MLRRTPSTIMLLGAIVLVALGLRVALLVAEPQPYDNAGLAADHGELARNVVDHGRWFEVNRSALELVGREQTERQTLVDPASLDYTAADADRERQAVVLQPVGQGVVLAGLWKLSGDKDYLYMQLLQALVDSLMVLLVYWIALSLFRRPRTALLAAALYALFLPIALITRIPHLDIWAVDLTIAVTAAMTGARASERPWPGLVAAGLVAGVGLYFRPGLALLPVALAAAWLPWSGWRRSLAGAAVPVILAGLLAVPWIVRNYDEFDRFVPTRIGIGQNLWEGLGEIENDFGAELDDVATAEQVAKEDPSLVYGSPEYDDHLREKATDAIKDHPGHFAKVVARRLAVTTIALHNLALPLGLVEPLLFLLALLVLALTRRLYPREHLFLAAVPIATLLPYLALHVEARYMLPASFAYLIWLALGADLLLERRAAAR